MIRLAPLSLREANAFIAEHHRHNQPVRGCKMVTAAEVDGRIVGVGIVGRPVSRMLQTKEPRTAEVTRLCTDGTNNACSKLYSACARGAEAMGFDAIVTYILESETGTSLRGSGWVCEGPAGGGCWDRPSRGRTDKAPIERKVRWRKKLHPR